MTVPKSSGQWRYEVGDHLERSPVATTLYDLGVKYSGGPQQNLKWAVECLEKALFLEPDYLAARNNLGHCLILNKEFGKAEEVLTGLVEENPNYERAILNLGNVFLAQEAFEDAIEQFKKVTSGYFAIEASYDIGLVHSFVGDETLSSAAFSHALDLCEKSERDDLGNLPVKIKHRLEELIAAKR